MLRTVYTADMPSEVKSLCLTKHQNMKMYWGEEV